MIPCWAVVNIEPEHGRRLRLWLPLILLWIVLAPLAVLLIPVVAVGALVVRLNPVKTLGGFWRVFCALSGVRVEVKSRHAAVFILVQ